MNFIKLVFFPYLFLLSRGAMIQRRGGDGFSGGGQLWLRFGSVGLLCFPFFAPGLIHGRPHHRHNHHCQHHLSNSEAFARGTRRREKRGREAESNAPEEPTKHVNYRIMACHHHIIIIKYPLSFFCHSCLICLFVCLLSSPIIYISTTITTYRILAIHPSVHPPFIHPATKSFRRAFSTTYIHA